MGSLKARWRTIRPGLIPAVAVPVVRALCATLRMRVLGEEGIPQGPVIFCGWHGKSLLFANRFRGRGYYVIISHSNDGEMQASIFGRLGYRIIRGSTGRGGVRALAESIRALKQGHSMAMTPDGPRGPSGVVQEGVVAMAQKSGAALIPVGLDAIPKRCVNSWDRYMIPLPFGRASIVFGQPIWVPADVSPEGFEAKRLELQEAIFEADREAERVWGAPK